MKAKLTRKQLAEMYSALEQLAAHARSVKVSYAIAKNRARLRNEVEAVQTASAPSKEFMDFEKRRIATCETHAMRGSDGEALIKNFNYVVTDHVALEKAVDAIREEFTSVIAQRDKQLEELKVLLAEEVEVELYIIPFEEVEKGLVSDVPSLALLLEPLLGYIIQDSQ